MSDKNHGPAIVTDSWYDREVSCLLSEERFYKEVEAVQSISVKRKMIYFVKIRKLYWREVHVIYFSIMCRLPPHSKLLPKVHGCRLVGRPIAASTKTLITPASRLYSGMPTFPSYLFVASNRLNDFLNKQIDIHM